MKYEVQYTSKFKKDFKVAIKRGNNSSLLKEIVTLLAEGKPLPENNRDHALTGNWSGYRECHITPDWLLIYKIYENSLILTLTRTGSHSDLF